MSEGKPSMLFECKCCTSDLNGLHAGQLRRYFHVTSARIGVLTNGIIYQFFSDLDEPNIMDKKPFMEIDLLDLEDQLIPELKKLTKSSFELEQMLSAASNLKYTRAIKGYFERQLLTPDQDFVRLVLVDIYNGIKTQLVIEQFTPLVKQAFMAIINENINARLKSAMSTGQKTESSNNDLPEQEQPLEDTVKGVITTHEEMEAYYIIRAILRQVVDVERVTMRDTKSYCGILLDDNNRKPVCRLHFNTQKKYIGIFDEKKIETRFPIVTLNEIYNFTDQIRSSIFLYGEK